MNKWMAIVLLAVVPAWAQRNKVEKEGMCETPLNAVRKILQIQSLQPSNVGELGRGLGLCVAYDNVGRFVAVSGSAAAVKELEDMLKKYDSRPRAPQVEFVGYLIQAAVGATDSQGAEVPALLDPVMQQLKTLFPYKAYSLVDTMITRVTASGRFGNASLSGRLPKGGSYGLELTVSEVQPPPEGRASFERLNLVIREDPTGPNQQTSQLVISTTTAIRDSQKVVIGKANSNRANEAYFFVATVRIVD